jgi:hypothetical protein
MHAGPKEVQLTANIQTLKKVLLSLVAGSEPGKFNMTASPVDFEFIYGVASDGLCPFESALGDKCEGDSLDLNVPSGDAHEYFGHFFHPLRLALGLQIMPAVIALQVKVTTVVDADNREVVQSLAKSLSHGGCGGGSCGCGC